MKKKHDTWLGSRFLVIVLRLHRPVAAVEEDYLLLEPERRQPPNFNLRKLIRGIVVSQYEWHVHARLVCGFAADNESVSHLSD